MCVQWRGAGLHDTGDSGFFSKEPKGPAAFVALG